MQNAAFEGQENCKRRLKDYCFRYGYKLKANLKKIAS
jgi:hypothetical protein